jgi:hypothetical protein
MRVFIFSLVCLALFAGCDEPTATTSVSPSPSGSAPPPPASPASSATANTDADEAQVSGDRQTEEDVTQYDREVVSVGVGKQGRNYGGGLISEPIRQYFRAGQKIQLLQMEQTMRHFKALNDRNPESHEEFMEEIINKGGVQLPELPAGERYRYDPERGELMVERKRPRE